MGGFGAYSEVGVLRKVIVHRPGLEMRRLTPTNAAELLFDDVIWARAARDHHDRLPAGGALSLDAARTLCVT